MSSQPLVSIVIPCYNAEQYVAEAIQSALDQTYPNCEVIVIDDGSTDNSLDVIKHFGDRIYWETGPNRGGCAARNRGIELAKGEWIQFLDADDLIANDKIEKQIKQLHNNSQNSIACCKWSFFQDDECKIPQPQSFWRSYNNGIDLFVDMWTTGGYFPVHSWLTSTTLIQKSGLWDETLTADQDGEFFGRVLASAGNILYTNKTEVYYRIPNANNVSNNISMTATQSRIHSWQSGCNQILSKRSDRQAQTAILRRLRSLIYTARDHPDILDQLHSEERKYWIWDWSPTLPLITRSLSSFIGTRRALQIRRVVKNITTCRTSP